MKFNPEFCPTCGDSIHGTVETLKGFSFLEFVDGEYQYDGETEMWYDEQKTITKNGKALVQCAYGHEWYAKRSDFNDTN